MNHRIRHLLHFCLLHVILSILFSKVNVKLSLCFIDYAPCHEDVWWSASIAPLILNLGTIWR
jgi:hypothetical protein